MMFSGNIKNMDTRKKIVINKNKITFLKPNLKSSENLYKVVTIFKSSANTNFLIGESHDVVLLNQQNILTGNNKTIAKFSSDSKVVEVRTSERVANLIGEKNYNTLFSALCSIISPELRVRGMLALLTVPKNVIDIASQTSSNEERKKTRMYNETSCQTDETCIDLLKMRCHSKRIRKPRKGPVIVKDDCVPNIPEQKAPVDHFNGHEVLKQEPRTVSTKVIEHNLEKSEYETNEKPEKTHCFPDINLIIKEDTNFSDSMSITNISASGISTQQSGLEDSYVITNHNICFNPTLLTTYDGTEIKLPMKPESIFHIASPEILKNVTHEERSKLILHQAYIDWKYCLVTNEDYNLPIHQAVMFNDLTLVKRQCLMLKRRDYSVDYVSSQGNLTALQLSLKLASPECTALLLEQGADPLYTDEMLQTPLHLAAESSPGHVISIIDYCKKKAKEILEENDNIRGIGLEGKSQDYLEKYIVRVLTTLENSQGYTPLMLASKMGNYETVKVLAELSPDTIDVKMTTSGNTALYVAVTAASFMASEHNNDKTLEKYCKIIETLIENGADAEICNHSGRSILMLLQELNGTDIGVKILRILSRKHTEFSECKDYSNAMLLKKPDGSVKLTDINTVIKEEKPDLRPVILENLPVMMSVVDGNRDSKTIKIEPTMYSGMEIESEVNSKVSTPSQASTTVVLKPKSLQKVVIQPKLSRKIMIQPRLSKKVVIKQSQKVISHPKTFERVVNLPKVQENRRQELVIMNNEDRNFNGRKRNQCENEDSPVRKKV